MSQSPITHQWPLRIYYEDTDAGGVVYHANYLKFFERARTEYFASWYEEDLFEFQTRLNCQFAVKTVSIDYIKSALLGQHCIVETSIIKQTPARLFFEQVLKLKATDVVLCQATVQVVCLTAQGKPRRLP
ncbi:MAG: hypothetical protein CMF48_01515 [Legionellales bacterium]|nr:hypothetical protein [Legionellales bacterium]|tara:strand:+ start:255 stop:644 length:390 start_codon:yes stop_codon:yes gene_type:complete